jgi:pimeloyl-ACP methyl ester carboxylesterase
MSPETAPPGYKELSFRLELSFRTFGEEKLRAFVSDLATLTASKETDFKYVGVRRGCVNVYLKVPKRVADQLIQMFGASLREEDDPEYSGDIIHFRDKWKLEEITQYESEINIMVKRKPFKQAVIFVHGWSGDKDSFGILPDYFITRHACAVYVFPYPSSALGESPSVTLVGDALHEDIKVRFRNHKLAFLGHSQGGLVIRRFVVRSWEGAERLDLNVKNIAFIASPFNGTMWADIANRIPLVGGRQLSDLSQGSSSLYQLNQRWTQWTDKYVPQASRIKCWFGTNDQVVPLNSMTGGTSDAVPVLGKGHIDIVKPKTEVDPIVTSLESWLRDTEFWNSHLSTTATTKRLTTTPIEQA